MRKIILVSSIVLFIIVSFIYAQEDAIEVAPVEKKETGDLLDTGIVKKLPTKTPTFTYTSTNTYTVTLTPTKTPTPRPKIKKKKRRIIKKVTPKFPEFKILNLNVVEIAQEKNLENLYGFLPKEKKYNIYMTIKNISKVTTFYTTAELKTKDPYIIIKNPTKDLQTVLPDNKRELVFEISVTDGYEGGNNLPLYLKVKARGWEKDYPIEVIVSLPNPYLVYGVIGGGILFFILLLILIFSRKKKKKVDFNVK